MGIEAVVIGIIVALVFGVFQVRKKKKQTGTTKIIIVKDGDDVEIDTGNNSDDEKPSYFKRILTLVVSAAAGFAAAGLIIVNFIEPEIGPVDPDSPVAIFTYIVMTLIIFGIIRGLSRN